MKHTLTLPWPPTFNTYWRFVKGRVLISKKGRQYRKAVQDEALVQGFPRLGDARLRVAVLAYPPDRRRRDLDNLPKGLLDALGHAGVYDDDSQIDDLRIKRGLPIKGGLVDLEIEAA